MYVLVFIFIFAGAYSLILALMRLPPKSVSENMQRMYVMRAGFARRIQMKLFDPLIRPLSVLLPLSEKIQIVLEADLKRAGLPYGAKEYYARAIIFSAVSLPILLVVWILGLTFIVPIACVLPFLLFRKYSIEHKDILKKKRDDIELALPHFIRSILYKLNNADGMVQVDIIAVFEDYIKIAEKALEYDVKLLVTEMKSKSVVQALHNFEYRLGLPEIGFLVRALVGMYNGQPQTAALATLSRDIDIRARENIKRALDKLPGKIKLATMPLVVVGIAALLYVLIYHMILTSSGLF